MNWFEWLFSNVGFMPRAICGIWSPGMIFLHNASDFLIWTAYIAIPLVLVKFAYARRRELPFRKLFWLFGLFILACGTTHLMDIVMFYNPLYRLAGIIKLVTAAASWGTVIALFHVTPLALRMRSSEDLEQEIQQRTSELQKMNAELNASEEQFRTMANSIPQLAWMARADGFIVWYNRRWHDYTGKTPEQMEGWGWQSVHDPEVLPVVMERWQEAIAKGQPFDMEFPLLGADGTFRIFLTRVEPVNDAQGIVVRWFGTNTDIDDQKRVQQELSSSLSLLEAKSIELSSSEARFRMLTEVIPQIVWMAQPDGFLDYYNAHWVEYTGMTIEQTQGWGWQPVLHPDDLNNCMATWTESVRTGESYEVEYRFKRASDGAYRWHLGRAVPLRDEAGNITKWFGTCTDIDDQKRVQEQLASSLSLLNATIESTADGIMALDLAGNIVSHNTKFSAMWQLPDELLQRRDGFEVRAYAAEQFQDPDGVFQLVEKQRSAPEIETFHVIEMKDGRTYERYGFPQRVDGECVGIVVNFRDITERKRAEAEREVLLLREQTAREEAESANATKGKILSRISHELRTPLNAILGFGQLLEMQDDQLTPGQIADIGRILKSGKHLLDLVNEVLDITRIDAPDSTLSLEPVALSEVAREAMEMLQPLVNTGGISIVQQLDLAAPIFVLADRQRLLQIMLNLLANGIKFNKPDGQIIISAEILPENRVRLDITDTGHGIAAADMTKLFVPFVRLNAEKLGVEGTGLGLVLCRRLAQAMNGSLEAQSELGQGSTFSLELPLAQFSAPLENGDSIAPSLNGEGPDATTTSSAELVILLIEDNISNFQLIERILSKRSNVRLIGAMQGGLGLQLAQQQRPDLILLDLHLPDIMGDEVLRRLREAPETQNIPVIMVSADASPSEITRLLAEGAQQYMTKPLEVKKFLQVIDKAIAAR